MFFSYPGLILTRSINTSDAIRDGNYVLQIKSSVIFTIVATRATLPVGNEQASHSAVNIRRHIFIRFTPNCNIAQNVNGGATL